jgi:hypothetical protein
MDNGADHELDPAVVERVRRDLAALGSDEASAPDVPPDVTARVVSALRAEPAHASRRPPLRRRQVLGLVVGLGALLAGVVVAASLLARDPGPTLSFGPTAQQITVSRPADTIPLPAPQIVALLSRAPDYGALSDARRRESCLDGLGYAAGTPVLGARPLDMHGRPAVLLLLPGDTPEAVVAKVVDLNCSATHTDLLAATVVSRP